MFEVMMGKRDEQKELFSYHVDLDKRVRADHPLVGSDLSIKHWCQKRGQPIGWFVFQVDWLSRGRVIKSHAAQITGRISRCHVSYHEQRRPAGDHFSQ